MQSKATTVDQYLAELPVDRRRALQALREVILKNIDKGYVECMGYGMMGYAVPHSIFPAGYHCDPKQPLPFAGMASQKQYMSLYLMCLYGDAGAADELRWFQAAWAKSGKKKLDMGKSCIRFKSIDDLPLDVIGEAFRRMPVKKYVALYEASLKQSEERRLAAKGARKKAGKKTVAKKAPKKAATKVVSKATAQKRVPKKK